MSQKDEYPVNNRLSILRGKRGLDNNDLKKIGISKEQIKKYESNVINLPIDKAIKISKKYNCSLDWLYYNEKLNSKNYLLDIHELFTCDDKFIYISIPRKYMNYFNNVNEIEKSDSNDSIKKHEYSKSNKELNSDKDNEIICVAKIAKNKFINIIKTSDGETYPFDDEYFDEVEDDISPVKDYVVKQILNNTNLNEDHIIVISGYIDKIIEGNQINEKENVFVMRNNIAQQILNNRNLNEKNLTYFQRLIDIINNKYNDDKIASPKKEEKSEQSKKSKKIEEFFEECSNEEEGTVRARKLSSIKKNLGKLSDKQIEKVITFIKEMIK